MAESVLGQNLSLLLVVAGAILVIGEALAPGAHFMVLGVTLLAAGIAGLLLPSSLGVFAPLILAAFVLIIGAITLYGYRNFDLYGGKGAGQTTSSDDLRGKTGRVTERVTETSGEVKLSGGGFNPHYQARCVDGEIDEGTEIIVLDPGGGNVVTVEALDDLEDEIDRELAQNPNHTNGTNTDSSSTDSTDTDSTDRDVNTA